MKKVTVIIAVILFSTGYAFAQKASDDFSGKWKTGKGAIVNIFKTQTGFTGVAGENKITVLKDIRFTDGKWQATIQTLKGDSIPCELVLVKDKLEIKAKKGIFTKSLEWEKV